MPRRRSTRAGRTSLHRVMNARADDPGAVIGDFDGASVAYAAARRGSRATDGGYVDDARARRAGRCATASRGRSAGAGCRSTSASSRAGDGRRGAAAVRLVAAPRRLGRRSRTFDPWLDEARFDAYAPVREPWAERCPWCHSTYPFAQRIARVERALGVGHGLEQLVRDAPRRPGRRSARGRRAGHDRHQLRELPPRRPRARRRRAPIHFVPRRARAGAPADDVRRRARAIRDDRQRRVRAVPLGPVAAARRRHRAAQLERGARPRGVAVHRHHAASTATIRTAPTRARDEPTRARSPRARAATRARRRRGRPRARRRRPRRRDLPRLPHAAHRDGHRSLRAHAPHLVADRAARCSPTRRRTRATCVTSTARSRGPLARSTPAGTSRSTRAAGRRYGDLATPVGEVWLASRSATMRVLAAARLRALAARPRGAAARCSTASPIPSRTCARGP